MAIHPSYRAERMAMPSGTWPGFGVVLEGFRVISRQPLVWPVWIILSILTAGGTMLARYGIAHLGSHPPPTTAYSAGVYVRTIVDQAWRQLALLPVFALGYGISIAAYSRAVIEPRHTERTYVRFGPPELRITLAILTFMAIINVLEMALIGGVISIMFAAGMEQRFWAVNLAGLVILLAFLGGVVWLASQFWFGPADILARGAINARTVWRLGAGRRVRLFWAFVTAVAVAGLFFVAGQVFSAAVWAKLEHQPLEPTLASLLQRTDGAASPWHWSTLMSVAVYSIFGSVGFAVMMCPAARIYSALSPKVEEVF